MDWFQNEASRNQAFDSLLIGLLCRPLSLPFLYDTHSLQFDRFWWRSEVIRSPSSPFAHFLLYNVNFEDRAERVCEHRLLQWRLQSFPRLIPSISGIWRYQEDRWISYLIVLLITPRWKVRNVYWNDKALSGEVIVNVLTFSLEKDIIWCVYIYICILIRDVG